MAKTFTHWYSQYCLNRSIVPNYVSAWLLEKNSMTERMRSTCRNGFSVQLLTQKWSNPSLDEINQLKTNARERVVIREVKLLCDKQICLYARSLFPKKTLRGKGISIHALGSRPLIDFLNLDPTLKRSSYEIARLKPGDYYYEQACSHLIQYNFAHPGNKSPGGDQRRESRFSPLETPSRKESRGKLWGILNNTLPLYLWARRSVFSFFKEPILLVEVFMPEIFERKSA